MTDKRRRARWPLFLSGTLLVAAGVVYGLRPAAMAGAFIWPMTFWVVPGLVLGASARGVTHLVRAGVLLAWFIVWFAMDDQPRAFLPSLAPAVGPITKVVSVNCAGGDVQVAREALTEAADIYLFQESPSSQEIQRLREELGPEWGAVTGPDASILAKGKLDRAAIPPGTGDFVAARWNDTLIVSLRLTPPVFRLDYYAPACWAAYQENRDIRRAQLAGIMAWVTAHRHGESLILGGDFNTPPDPWVQAPLRSQAVDAFAAAGRGWGGTAINALPLVRIDQVWAGGKWRPISARARKSRHSDHRMVIVEVRERN